MNGNCSLSCRGKSSLVAKMLVISQWFLNKHDVFKFHTWLLFLNNYLQSHSCSSSFVIVIRFLQHVSPVELQGKTCSSDCYKILKISQGCTFFFCPINIKDRKGIWGGIRRGLLTNHPPKHNQLTMISIEIYFFFFNKMNVSLSTSLPSNVSNTILI